MRITALEEYGVRCLLRIAREQEEGELVSAQTIAAEEGMSVPYAQKVLRVLSKSGLIESRRGAGGGYQLARPVHRISVGDAVRAVGAMFESQEVCDSHTGELDECAHLGCCSIRPVWSHIEEFVVRMLDALPLSVLLEDEETVQKALSRIAPVPEERDFYCPVAAVDPPETTSISTQ